MIGSVVIEFTSTSCSLNRLRFELRQAKLCVSSQLELLVRREGPMLEDLKISRPLNVDAWLAVMLARYGIQKQREFGPLLRQLASGWPGHTQSIGGDPAVNIGGRSITVPDGVWSPIMRRCEGTPPKDIGAPIISTNVTSTLSEKMIGLAYSDIKHVCNCLPLRRELVEAWICNVFVIVPFD